MSTMKLPSIPEYYSGKTIVMTGGTGFLGSYVVEKLLRDCPDVEKIILITRPKNRESVQQRLESFISHPVFARIRGTSNEWRKKIEFVEGDIGLPFCGLTPAAITEIHKSQIMFHSAAIVDFNMPLAPIVKQNSSGTYNALQLAARLKNLEAFVYVSSSTTAPNLPLFEEKLYPLEMDAVEMLKLLNRLPSSWKKALTPTIVGERTTYQYSKHLSEKLVESFHPKLPVCIVRPGAIVASVDEPFPGWNETDVPMSECFRSVFSGETHSMPVDGSYYTPLTPTDTTGHTVLAAAWRLANVKGELDIQVYNCVPSKRNSLLFKDLMNFGVQMVRDCPAWELNWYPHSSCTRFKAWYKLRQYFFRYLPSLLRDQFAGASAENSHVSRLKRAEQLATLYTDVMKNLKYSEVSTVNMGNLQNLMLPGDRKLFPIDMDIVDWNQFARDFVVGLSKFSKTSAVPPTRTRMISLKVMHWTMEGCFVIGLAILALLPIWALLFRG